MLILYKQYYTKLINLINYNILKIKHLKNNILKFFNFTKKKNS